MKEEKREWKKRKVEGKVEEKKIHEMLGVVSELYRKMAECIEMTVVNRGTRTTIGGG